MLFINCTSTKKRWKEKWWRSIRVFLYCSRAVKLQPLLPPTGQRENCRYWQQAHRDSTVTSSGFVLFCFFYWNCFCFNLRGHDFCKKGPLITQVTTLFYFCYETWLLDEMTSGREERLWHVLSSPFRFLHLIWKLRLEVDWKTGSATAKLTFRWCGNCLLPKQGHRKEEPSVLLTKLFRCQSLRLRCCFWWKFYLRCIITNGICCWHIEPNSIHIFN